MVFVFSWLNDLINLKNLSAPVAAWRYAVFLVILYILIVLYKAWIKDCWEFFKKDSIVHYIFLAVIPVAIVFLGYQYVFKSSVNNPTPDKDKKVQTVRTLKNDYDEIIDRLNGFYAVLFTAIAVIAAILAFGAWRTIKELKEKLESYKKIENDVEFLKKKKDLAEWVQGLFDKDDEKKIISSTELPISRDGEEKQYEEIKEQILKEATDDSWLKIVYAKKLVEQAKKPIQNIKSFSYNTPEKKNEIIFEIQNIYNRVDKIFKFIESRDLFKPDSDVEMYLHNLLGQLYLEWYRVQNLEFQTEFKDANQDIPWKDWWMKKQNEKEQEHYVRLKNSERYYRNALEITEEKRLDENETLGNLALVLIELSKFPKESEPKKKLEEAKILLHRRRKKDFNKYWDLARILYYLNSDGNDKEIKDLLNNAVKEIDNKKDRDFFIDRLDAELNEKIDGKDGFPGDKKIIDKLEEDLKGKELS